MSLVSRVWVINNIGRTEMLTGLQFVFEDECLYQISLRSTVVEKCHLKQKNDNLMVVLEEKSGDPSSLSRN